MAWTVLVRWPSKHRHDPGHHSYVFDSHAQAEKAAVELRKQIKSKAKGAGVVLTVRGREVRVPRTKVKIEIVRAWERQASHGDSSRGAAQREALLEAAHMGQIRPGGRHLLATLRQLEARGLLKRAPGGDRYVITSLGTELVARIRASGRRARTGYTRFVALSPEELESKLVTLRKRRR